MMKPKAISVFGGALSFTDNHSYGFFFFPPHYCYLIITDEIIDTLAVLIDCIPNNAQIYFHTSDVLSCSENITDCVYINFVS